MPTLSTRADTRLRELRVPAALSVSRPSLSLRSSRADETSPQPNGPYYSHEEPEGTINLSTAENSLIAEEVLQILHQGTLSASHLKYRNTLLRSSTAQLADLLPSYVNRQAPVRPITRANSVPGPGIGSLLASLVWTLCDPGDGVLLSTPRYHEYVRDIVYPASAVPRYAEIPANLDPLSVDAIPFLRAAIEADRSIRVIILCNPHNPIPRCYPPETIDGYAALALECRLHLVVDEIFANTVFPTRDNPDPLPFASILSTRHFAADSPVLQQVHVLAGPTKDLGCSGLKAGLLVSENEGVRENVASALKATPISGATDALLSELLAGTERLDRLLELNKIRLGEAMDLWADWSRFHGFPYIGANAGVYFIIDLTAVAKKMGLQGKEATLEIMRKMHSAKIHINPLDIDMYPLPHRFRVIFTQKPEVTRLAQKRLEEAFGLDAYH